MLFCRENKTFFLPSRYLRLLLRTVHAAEHAGVRRAVFCLRHRQTANPSKQNRKPQLLSPDLAAIAKEIRQRGEKTECSVTIGAGLPLTLFGREKKAFREYLLYPEKPEDSLSPVCFKFEGVPYRITVQDVKLFPQGYSALAVHPELLRDEPSVLLMDIGGWTVDLMRLDKGIPNAYTCRSLELGMIRCVDEIREQVRRDTGLSLTDAQTERILSGKPCSLPEETRAIVRRQGRLYTERLFSAVTEAGFDCRALPVIPTPDTDGSSTNAGSMERKRTKRRADCVQAQPGGRRGVAGQEER